MNMLYRTKLNEIATVKLACWDWLMQYNNTNEMEEILPPDRSTVICPIDSYKTSKIDLLSYTSIRCVTIAYSEKLWKPLV